MQPAWGIYIHVPFCPYQCVYCDFDAGVYPETLQNGYVDAVLSEMARVEAERDSGGMLVDTIYFGGGTPSLLPVDQLERLLIGVHSHFTVTDDAEITIEANPESITRERAGRLKAIGVTRVSIGVQSFNGNELRLLGRGHTVKDVDRGYSLLREAGFCNLSLDLIAGIPGQSLENWAFNLDRAFLLRPEHLSVYLLEVHSETVLADLLDRGRLPRPDDAVSVHMYNLVCDRAAAEGYVHYEISNLCVPGYYSRHNLKYWSDEPYLGFGSSAASYDGKERRVNVKTPSRYVEWMAQHGHAIESRTPVTEESWRQEALFLGLRRIQGIDVDLFRNRYGLDPLVVYRAELAALTEAGLVTMDNHHLRLTRKGLTLSNEVFSVFV